MTKIQFNYKQLIIYRLLMGNIITFFLQFGGLAISMLVPRFSFVWFASGTACALCFLKGPRLLPGIYLGSLSAYYLSNSQFILSNLLAFLNTFQAFLLLQLTYLNKHPIPFIYQKLSMLKFIIHIAIVTAIISFLMIWLCYPYLSPKPFFLNWWLANFNGAIIFYLMIIACDVYFPEYDLIAKKDKIVFSLLALLLMFFLIILVNAKQPITIVTVFISTLLYSYVSFLRYQAFGLIFSVFSISFGLGLSSFSNTPIWNTAFSLPTLFYLQITLLVFTLSIITLSMYLAKTKFNNFS